MTTGRMRQMPSYALAVILLAGGAVCNGYPLVYSDSGTYLDSSFGLKVPIDRPGAYGFFLLVSHWKRTLWLPIVLQSAILVFLIDTIVAAVLGQNGSRRSILPVVIVLTIATSLPWFVGQLMPDVFAGALILSLFLLMFCSVDLPRSRRRIVEMVCVLATAVHFSHILLAIGLVMLVTSWSLTRWSSSMILPKRGAACVALSIAISVLFNLARTGEPFLLSRVSHIFLMGRLVEDGVIQRLLNDHCEDRNYGLCRFRDRLVANAEQYIWSANSPMKEIGGFEGSRGESRRMIVDSVLSYPGTIVVNVVRAFCDQFVRFRTGDGLGAYGEETWIGKVIQRRFPREAPSYFGSLQQRGFLWLRVQPLADFHELVAIGSFVLSPLLILLHKRRGPSDLRVRQLHAFVWLALALNAALTGALSTSIDRYQARIVWLVPFAVSISLGVVARERWTCR